VAGEDARPTLVPKLLFGNAFTPKFPLRGALAEPYLDKKDADACMAGKKCVNLAVQVAQFLAEFEDILTPRKPGGAEAPIANVGTRGKLFEVPLF